MDSTADFNSDSWAAAPSSDSIGGIPQLAGDSDSFDCQRATTPLSRKHKLKSLKRKKAGTRSVVEASQTEPEPKQPQTEDAGVMAAKGETEEPYELPNNECSRVIDDAADGPVQAAAKPDSDGLCQKVLPAEEAKEVQEKIRQAAEKMKQAEEEIMRAEQRAKYLAEQEIKEAERKARQAEELARVKEEMKAANERREYYAQFVNRRVHLIDAAVEDSILGRAFEDVELRVYSQRTKPGAAHTTLPVYARTAFLEVASPVLNELLAKTPVKAASGHVPPRNPSDFLDEDSDLEEDESVVNDKSIDSTVVGDDIDEAILDEILEDIRAVDMSTGTETTAATPTATGLRVIHVEYGAAKTWQALIYYLYTGRVSFRNNDSHSAARLSCSPRSMYMLATKLSLDDLKNISEEAIISGLSAANIVKELFSDFTWRYPDILAREVEIFRGHAQDPMVRAELKAAFKEVATGKFPRRGEVILAAIFDALMAVPPASS